MGELGSTGLSEDLERAAVSPRTVPRSGVHRTNLGESQRPLSIRFIISNADNGEPAKFVSELLLTTGFSQLRVFARREIRGNHGTGGEWIPLFLPDYLPQ